MMKSNVKRRLLSMVLAFQAVCVCGITAFAETPEEDKPSFDLPPMFTQDDLKATYDMRDGETMYVYENANGDIYKRWGFATLIELGVNYVGQKYSNWCWAACAEMIGTFGVKTDRDQGDAVLKVKKELVNATGNAREIAQAIDYISYGIHQAYTVEDGVLSDQASYQEIENDRPFVCTLYRPKTKGLHDVVARGYEIPVKDHSEDQIFLYNPADPQTNKYYKYSEMTNPYQSFKIGDNYYTYEGNVAMVAKGPDSDYRDREE